ncbi:MAG: hypothetical protein WD227_15865, partial [Vicinamibacterales bacterium]
GRCGAKSTNRPPPPGRALLEPEDDEDPALDEPDELEPPPPPEGRETALPELVPDEFGRAPCSPLGFEECSCLGFSCALSGAVPNTRAAAAR